MNLLVGGPVGSDDRCDLEDPKILLAQLSTSTVNLMAQGIASTIPVSDCTSMMESVLGSASRSDATGTAASALPVLAQYPDSHEAKRALQEVEFLAANTTTAQLQDMAAAVMNAGMEHQSAPEAYAACTVVYRHAAAQESSKNEQAAYDAYGYVVDAASRSLSQYPNTPEAYRLAGLFLDAADYLGENETVDSLAKAQPGTLLAWRLAELQTGERPPFSALQNAEAKYGLLAAWRQDIKNAPAASETAVLRNDACALADEALWAHPDSAVQTRIMPLYFGLIRELPRTDAASRVFALTDAVNAAESSMTTWMCRAFLYREYSYTYHDFGTGSFQLLNMADDLALGFVDAALKDESVSPKRQGAHRILSWLRIVQ